MQQPHRQILDKYIARFRNMKTEDYFFRLLESLMAKYPENHALCLNYARFSLETQHNLQLALMKLQEIPKKQLQANHYWFMGRLMRELGDCQSIKNLLTAQDIDEPSRRLLAKQLEFCGKVTIQHKKN